MQPSKEQAGLIAAKEYENDVLQLELQSLQQQLTTFDHDTLALENHNLRKQVCRTAVTNGLSTLVTVLL